MLILPLIKTGLVKTMWLQDTFQMGYFLINDFSVFRTSSKMTSNTFLRDNQFKPYSQIYFNHLNEVIKKYAQNFISSADFKLKETHICLQFRSTLKYLKIFNLLRNGPRSSEEILKIADKSAIEELFENDFITLIRTKTDEYYALLFEIRLKKFVPKYLLYIITQKLAKNEITKEMAFKHLDFLYHADAN